MKLHMKIVMKVTGTAAEADKVDQVNRQCARNVQRCVKLDDSLVKDLTRLLDDFGQLMNRADARRKRKGKR